MAQERELKELQTIKSLLVVLLFKLGASTEEVGSALGLGLRRVQQMYPLRKIRKIKHQV